MQPKAIGNEEETRHKMGVFNNIKEWLKNMFWTKTAEEEFGIKLASESKTVEFIEDCMKAYKGEPYWMDEKTRTINMAKTVCEEIARLATLNIEVNVTGSARAEYLQKQVDKMKPKLRHWVEYGCAGGEIIVKPNGYAVDIVFPGEYVVTEEMGAEITGIVFYDDYYNSKSEEWFTRLEYHRIENGRYLISNRCYKGDSKHDLKQKVDIKDTRWNGLDDEITAEGVDKMLFGILKMPNANNIEPSSNRALPIFSNAMEELFDADVAYSRMGKEIWDSSRTVIMDSDRLMVGGGKKGSGGLGEQQRDTIIKQHGLPEYVRMVEGTGSGDIYHEINPTLNTAARLQGLNAILSQIGFKCGFSNGYFVFNEKTGMVTATQVESDDRRTIQLISDVRKQLEACLDGLIYALDRFADAYELAPRGKYEVNYLMDDITENFEEDKARWLAYVQMGKVPFWYYLTKYEGFSEEEAKELENTQTQEQIAQMGLFAQPMTE